MAEISLSGNANKSESEQADLRLLVQNLSHSRKISTKTTLLLSSFDDRLARLEKTVSFMHKSTLSLNVANTNLSAILKSIDLLLSHNDLVESEEVIISQGPKLAQLDGYLESITRVVDALEQLRKTAGSGLGHMVKNQRDQDDMARRMQSAIALGAQQLNQVVVNWAKEASSPGVVAPVSPTLLRKMTDLSHFIHALPPGALAGADRDLHSAYADARAQHLLEVVSQAGRQAIDGARLGTCAGGKSLGDVLQIFLHGLQVEYKTVISFLPPQAHASTYSLIVPPALHSFVETAQTINSIVKKSFSTCIGVGFVSYASLQEGSDEFDEWVRAKAGPSPGALRRDNELGDLIHIFRATCLRSFPEFMDDVKAWGSRRESSNAAASGLIADMTRNVIDFTKQLCEHQATSERFLSTLGGSAWSSSADGSHLTSPRLDGAEESPLLQKYLGDILSTLLSSLDVRARLIRTKVAPIFILNNIAYIRREVLSSEISDLLGDAVEDELNKRNRMAKSAYLELFAGLVSALMDGGSDPSLLKQGLGAVGVGHSGERRDVKDRFVRFSEALSEVENVHKIARLDQGEEDMRERLRTEVEKMIVPTYSKFTSRNVGAAPSKIPRIDVATVQARLNALF